MPRVSASRLKSLEDQVNYYLKNIKIKVGGRYGYYAIDVYDPSGQYIIDTVIAGLTSKQVYDFLQALLEILRLENSENRY